VSYDDDAPRSRDRSFLDRAIAWAAPTWAVEREMARSQLKIMASGGALASEKDPSNPDVGQEVHPDVDLIPDSPDARRRCTLAFYNNAVVSGIVKSQVRRVIGSLGVQCDTGDARADNAIERCWRGRLDAGLHEELKIAVSHMLIDGGCIPNPLGRFADPLRIETIPYRLIKNPYDKQPTPSTDTREPNGTYVRDGFEFNSKNELVAVHVERENTVWNSVFSTGRFARVPLFSHLCLERLSGQIKALSWYGASITRLDMVNRWMLALLTSAELHAYVVALCTAAGKDAKGLAGAMTTTGLSANDSSTVTQWARKHQILFMPNGSDWKLIQANAPTISDFIVANFRVIARQLGVSYERLTYDLTHTSFSSTKFGDRDDRLTVADQQEIVIINLLQPLHARLVAGMALRGELPAAGAYAGNPEAFTQAVRFTLPGCPPVDESKAEEANAKALENRTASRTRIAANRGDDAEEIVDEIIREDAYYFERRKAFWMKSGYEENVARDLVRDEILTRAKSSVAVAATEVEEEANDVTEPKEKSGKQTLKPAREAA
jgi:capsid protein